MMESPTSVEQRKDIGTKDGPTWDSDANGLIYRGGDCCLSTCTHTADHYHCQVCGVGTADVSQALAHIRTSPTCRKDHLVHYSASSVAMGTDPTNTLYNAIYNGFGAQNTYPAPGFSGFSQIDSFQWHPSMSEKVAICSGQLSPCCSSNGGSYIPVESQLCSPISDLYSKVTPIRDLVSLPAKSSGSAIDSPAWFAAYNPQQLQKSSYKYSDQNPAPQINFLILDPADQKHHDTGEANFCGKSDLGGRDILKESYCSYTSQPLPGILSDDTLFSLQLQDETLKQADLQQPSVPQALLSDITNKSTLISESLPTTSRAESHLTQENFSHYIASCSAYNPSLNHNNNTEESTESNGHPSSAASDSDESDIIVEDTGDDLGSQMTESEIFIEDIKCSLLQGVVTEDENQDIKRSEVYRSKREVIVELSRKDSKQSGTEEASKIQTESHLKSCLSSYHAILKCLICEKNVSDGNPGSVFVQMSSQMPVTTSSQTPVLTKLHEVVAIEPTDFLDVDGKFMCQSCFDLVDTVDCLESKLESLKRDIAAMIKAGSKPVLINHGQCAKLPVDLIEQNQSQILSVPLSVKNIPASASIQSIHELFQNALVENSSVVKSVIQDQEDTEQMTNNTQGKEYLLLSGQAFSVANSINKVSLSLCQNQSTDLGQEQCGTHSGVHEESCSLSKIHDIPLRPSVQSAPNDGTIASHIDQYTLAHKATHLESRGGLTVCSAGPGPAVVYQPNSKSPKECMKSPRIKKEESEQLRICEGNIEVQATFKDTQETEERAERKKLSLGSILSMDTEHIEEKKPHSSECIMENCHEILRVERTMQESIRKESNTGQQFQYPCDLCSEMFSSMQCLQDHISMYIKSNLDPALCELCGQLYHNQTQLDDHIFHAHFIYQKHCEFCGEKFFHPCMYNMHSKTYPGGSLSECSRLQVQGNNAAKRRGMCLETPLHVCAKCNQTFHMRSHLEHHIKATHVLKKALSKCDKCERTFIKPSDLQAHKRSHSNEKNFECKVCGRRYKSLGNLNHHAKSHDVQKPYTCDICSQGFLRKDFYETHINSHKDNKPFKCEKCLKSFSSKAYLQVHLKWHLDKLKKVTCPICKKTFSQRLNVHMRSHTGERPHPCEKCPKMFVTGSALRKHTKRIHQQEISTENEYSASDRSDSD